MEYLIGLLAAILAFDFFVRGRAMRRQWAEVASGRVDAHTLRKRTGIWDRAELEQTFGTPDRSFAFNVTVEGVRRARTVARRIFDSRWIDLSVLGMTGAGFGVLLSCGCTSLALAITMVPVIYRGLAAGHDALVIAWSHGQRSEESRARFELARSGA